MKYESKEKKEKEVQKDKYGFLYAILMENIGKTVDEFTKINMGQLLTKYNVTAFSLFIRNSIEKSKQEIEIEFEKILNNKEKKE